MTEILKGEELQKAKEAEATQATERIDRALVTIDISCHYIKASAWRIALNNEQVLAASQLEGLAIEMEKLAKAALRE